MAQAFRQTIAQIKRPPVSDPWLLLVALALTGLGLVMVYSSSSTLADKRYLDSAFFFKQQLLHIAVGLMIMAPIAFVDYHRLRKLVYWGLLGVMLALCLVLVPGLGHRAGGAARWLNLGIASLQPSELAKPALVLFLAHWLASNQMEIKSFKKVFLACLGVCGLLTAPILAQPDLGMTVTLFLLTLIMLFVAGSRIVYLLGIAVAALPALYFLIFRVDYRLERITAFLRPWDYPQDIGFQIIHSFLAFGSGGFWGAGLGESKQKLFYLPEPHTDFILAVLAEELGFLGVALVLCLFALLIWRGISIALSARDLFGSYLALGATLIIGLQAFINAAVVMGMLPTKGLTLPFISCGGSSLLANFICIGILLSVARYRRET